MESFGAEFLRADVVHDINQMAQSTSSSAISGYCKLLCTPRNGGGGQFTVLGGGICILAYFHFHKLLS